MKTHLEFYKKCMQTGFLPNVINSLDSGLCGAADKNQITKKTLDLMWPTSEDITALCGEGLSTGWWASGMDHDPAAPEEYKEYFMLKEYGFTSLRQTIVLFMAAINDEL